jgi:hypothetical protein
MGTQMNIKNTEAVELAGELAKAKGTSMTEIVVEALRALKRQQGMSRAVRVERVMAICRDTASRMSPEMLALDMDDFLYDEYGLPK